MVEQWYFYVADKACGWQYQAPFDGFYMGLECPYDTFKHWGLFEMDTCSKKLHFHVADTGFEYQNMADNRNCVIISYVWCLKVLKESIMAYPALTMLLKTTNVISNTNVADNSRIFSYNCTMCSIFENPYFIPNSINITHIVYFFSKHVSHKNSTKDKSLSKFRFQ